MFYILIMVLAVLLVIPVRHKKDSGTAKLCYILSFFISFLPAGLRYGIGTDYFYTYVPYFEWIGNGTKEYSEIGFNFLNKIIYNLTGDFRWLFFVTAFIILFFIYKAIWDNSEDIPHSVLLIFIGQSYFYSMNMIRQAVAIAIILYSYKFIKEKKYIRVLWCILFAALFHTSALIFIPIFALSILKISTLKKIILLVILTCFQPIFLKIVILILKYTKYSWYYAEGLFMEDISILLVIQNIIISLLDIYYQNRYHDKLTDEYKILSNINFFGICLMLLSYNIPLIYRLIRYCTIFQILFIPKIFNLSEKNDNKKILSFLLYSFLFICMIYQILFCGGEGVFPYKSIFKEV